MSQITREIDRVIKHLEANPEILLKSHAPSLSLEILFSDRKKRYTEFYRILAQHQKGKEFFWIRIVKNKPEDVIHSALLKQYSIMDKLFGFFEKEPKKEVGFSCSEPVALLLEYNTLITRECAGTLFNRYLKRKIPFIRQKELLTHCENCGAWLRKYHACFSHDNITLCHRDFSPRNIFVEKGFIRVIDFVGAENGDPREDMDFFSNYISKARFNGLYTKGVKKKMVKFFLHGYHERGNHAEK